MSYAHKIIFYNRYWRCFATTAATVVVALNCRKGSTRYNARVQAESMAREREKEREKKEKIETWQKT